MLKILLLLLSFQAWIFLKQLLILPKTNMISFNI
jgi:hypothetical protein